MAEAEPGLWAQLLGRIAYEFAQAQPMLPVYAHLIASALFPIYTGAHASLSRPSSAAKPIKNRPAAGDQDKSDGDEDEEEEEEEEERIMEGLSPTDALLMPLFAGMALASLYFLLKWMKDPALLNRILNGYFAIFGVFSVSRLVTDMLDTGHSLIFPRRHFSDGALYHVNGKKEEARSVAGDVTSARPVLDTPLPGFLSIIPLSDRVRKILWNDRAMPAKKWTLKMHIHRSMVAKAKVGPHGIAGIFVGLSTVLYFNLVDKPWYLTNLLGFGFSYGALQLMSPTTFATGSLILGALFFYDIYFVFFTPMMVTVAKSLDVPIKLMFPRPADASDPKSTPSHAMLGLGDVVLPGIMIGLALRFDLYLFYLRKQKRTLAVKEGEPDTLEKPQYCSLAGRWSDHFWTHSLMGRPLWKSNQVEKDKPEVPFTFPKTYFTAALVGYVLGLFATLGVMMIWNHAQPALLYLVPGVLGSLWLTALVRGEMKLMWEYTEEIAEEDDKEKVKNGKDKTKTGDGSANTTQHDSDDEDMNRSAQNKKTAKTARPEREVFSISIDAPWEAEKPRSKEKDGDDGDKKVGKEKHKWAPSENASSSKLDAEPAGKRVRLK